MAQSPRVIFAHQHELEWVFGLTAPQATLAQRLADETGGELLSVKAEDLSKILGHWPPRAASQY